MMSTNLYFYQIEDLIFELSIWRCNDELRARAEELHNHSKRDAKHYIGTIKEQLATAIAPALEHLCQQKKERLKEFSDVQSQIQRFCGEITGNFNDQATIVDESDYSLKKLEEY